MNPNDFVYKQVFSGCTKQGVCNAVAQKFAVITSEKFRKNQFVGNASALINDSIQRAKQEQKLNDRIK